MTTSLKPQLVATGLSLLLCSWAAAETTGTLELALAGEITEHPVPDCMLLHFHLPEPDPEGQIFSLEMLRSQSASSGPRIAVAGSVAEDGSAKGTFSYRDDNNVQWLPAGDDLDEMQTIRLRVDGKTLPQWVAAADRSKNEVVVNLEFTTITPLAKITNTGIQAMDPTTAKYSGQCTLNIPWLPQSLLTQ